MLLWLLVLLWLLWLLCTGDLGNADVVRCPRLKGGFGGRAENVNDHCTATPSAQNGCHVQGRDSSVGVHVNVEDNGVVLRVARERVDASVMEEIVQHGDDCALLMRAGALKPTHKEPGREHGNLVPMKVLQVMHALVSLEVIAALFHRSVVDGHKLVPQPAWGLPPPVVQKRVIAHGQRGVIDGVEAWHVVEIGRELPDQDQALSLWGPESTHAAAVCLVCIPFQKVVAKGTRVRPGERRVTIA